MKHPEILTIDGLLSAEECQDAITRIDRFLDHGLGYVAEDHPLELNNMEMRRDECIYMNAVASAESLQICHKLMDRMKTAVLPEYISRFPILERKTLGILECKAQRTAAGGGFHNWHFEATDGSNRNRWLVYTVYLNDTFEGGETEFLYQNMRMKPVTGRCCVFPAGFMHTHRGNPPIDGTKYILTGWVLDLDPYAKFRA